MYSASNKLAGAMKYNVPRRRRKSKNKSGKGDREYYRGVYLKSKHWLLLKRKKLLESPTCEKCGKENDLDIHHIRYKNLYDVELSDLQTLCRGCHVLEHKQIKISKQRKLNRKECKEWQKQRIREEHDRHWDELLENQNKKK